MRDSLSAPLSMGKQSCSRSYVPFLKESSGLISVMFDRALIEAEVWLDFLMIEPGELSFTLLCFIPAGFRVDAVVSA